MEETERERQRELKSLGVRPTKCVLDSDLLRSLTGSNWSWKSK